MISCQIVCFRTTEWLDASRSASSEERLAEVWRVAHPGCSAHPLLQSSPPALLLYRVFTNFAKLLFVQCPPPNTWGSLVFTIQLIYCLYAVHTVHCILPPCNASSKNIILTSKKPLGKFHLTTKCGCIFFAKCMCEINTKLLIKVCIIL